MPEIGENLSHYSIEKVIGKGGMGVVYRAKDQKLGRDVAIKVLPEEFARDTERVARFQREAKLLASLNQRNCWRVGLQAMCRADISFIRRPMKPIFSLFRLTLIDLRLLGSRFRWSKMSP